MVDFEFREHYTIDDLRRIVAILRHPGGCPWDAEQTHESLRRCLMEECCEVLEAIDRRDDALLCEELGDVLLQVYSTLLWPRIRAGLIWTLWRTASVKR